jgi:signal transduction histidine kinase
LRRTQQQLIQQEKLVSLGQLSAGIAHQIRNPLNFINNFAQLNEELIKELEEKPEVTVEEVRDLIQNLKLNESKINEHGQRADRIVQSLMYHASRAAGERERKDLNILVDEYINLAYHGMRAQRPDFNVNIERAYDEGAGEIVVVPQDIGQVLVNLCNNAFDAMQEEMARRGNGDGTKPDGVYEPRLTVRTNRLSNRVEIQIADNGPGVPKAERGRIFEPFFTTKTLGSGTGLGLSLSQDIVVKGHGGSLAVESAEPGGAVFIVKLPA